MSFFTELNIILASTSPRRKELLEQVGLQFNSVVIDIDESIVAGETAADYVVRLAREKAQAVVPQFSEHTLIIAADTTVTVDGQILGKPIDQNDAFSMWQLLSGRTHQVMTGVAVAYVGEIKTDLVITDVEFLPLSEAQMKNYWNSGEPIGKAGGYAIQGLGAAFIPRINGSYSNVVGLPLVETLALLTAAVA
ncbi:MAG: nucleoside triphosphate pyrophosphatase [Aquirhabdus sp.]